MVIVPSSELCSKRNLKLSKDGTKLLLYTYDPTNMYRVLIMDTDGTDRVTLCASGSEIRGMAISPDDQYVAYSSFESGQSVFVIAASGGAARRITNEASLNPDFSSDSKYVAYEKLNDIFYTRADIASYEVRLTDSSDTDESYPSFSHSTSEAVLACIGRDTNTNTYAIYKISLSGTVEKISPDIDSIIQPLLWSEDGLWLYFSGILNSGDKFTIYRTKADGTLTEAITTPGTRQNIDIAVFPGIPVVYYLDIDLNSAASGSGEIWAVDPSSKLTQQITSNNKFNYQDMKRDYDLSPWCP